MEAQKILRYRLNVSTSVKGVKTWDCTVELEAPQRGIDTPLYPGRSFSTTDPIPTLEYQALALSDSLVAELEKRYPAQIGEK